MKTPPTQRNAWHEPWASLLWESYLARTGRPLLPGAEALVPSARARALYEAPFCLLSHDGAEDPRLVYVNLAVQRLWEADWNVLVGMPSRLTAEPDAREARAEALGRARDQGYIDDYSGVRVSVTGRRFRIERAVVWTFSPGEGARVAQAATFSSWTRL